MTNSSRLMAGGGMVALSFALLPAVAMAQSVPTPAGTDINNTASISYTVANVPQQAVSASDTFKVDRKISMILDEVGNVTTSVAPGQTNAVTTFDLQNLTNGPMDFGLAAINETDAATKHGGTDTYDVTNLRIFVDSDTVAGWSTGDTQVTYLDELPAGATRRLFVVADVPTTASNAAVINGAVAEIRLTASALESGTANTRGGAIETRTVNRPTEVDSVFAEPAGLDTANDGIVFNKDDYTVAAAILTMVKQSRMLPTTIGTTSVDLAIPGAKVEYCIRVRNAANAATASGVSVTDTLTSLLTYVPNTLLVGGTTSTVNGATSCNADGQTANTVSGQTVTGAIGDIAAGAERTVLFQATIK